MLLGTFTDTAPAIGDMLDRGVDIQEPHQQARQATAMLRDRLHALALILSGARCLADHRLKSCEGCA
jgi:hypothetical protein